jgi:hypothetical protein
MSTTTVDDKIVKWMSGLLSCATENGRICRVELMHTVSEGADRIISVGIEEGQDVAELAQELWDAAEHDASTRGAGMPHRYVIRLFDTPSGEEHLAMRPFVIRGRSAMPFMDGDTEPANEKGITAQLMRTVENQNRLLVYNSAAISDELKREREARHIAEDREIALRKVHQDLLDRTAEREVQKAKDVMKARRTDELIGTIIPLVPLLLTKFLQGGLLPGAAPAALPTVQTPRDAAVEAFLKNLTPNEMSGVMAALRGMNQLTMVEVGKTFQSPATSQSSQARDITIAKLLKGLTGEELMGVIRALSEVNRESFTQIYNLYVEAHEAAQEGMPEVLKDEVTEH